MPKSKTSQWSRDATDLLRDILIVQLGVAGVPQNTIRDIVGGNIAHVNRIVRHLKAPKRRKS